MKKGTSGSPFLLGGVEARVGEGYAGAVSIERTPCA